MPDRPPPPLVLTADVECGFCDVGPRQPCVTGAGRPTALPHMDRVRLAIRRSNAPRRRRKTAAR